jgi:TPR repeat protein
MKKRLCTVTKLPESDMFNWALRLTIAVLAVAASKDQSSSEQALKKAPVDSEIRRYALAAEQGDAKAQYFLGTMYREGEGLKQIYT